MSSCVGVKKTFWWRKKFFFAIMTTQLFVLTVKNVDVFREQIAWFCFECSSEMEDFRSDPWKHRSFRLHIREGEIDQSERTAASRDHGGTVRTTGAAQLIWALKLGIRTLKPDFSMIQPTLQQDLNCSCPTRYGILWTLKLAWCSPAVRGGHSLVGITPFKQLISYIQVFSGSAVYCGTRLLNKT